MRAQSILNAITAMHQADRLGFFTKPELFAHILHRLASARMDLESELGAVGLTVEEIDEYKNLKEKEEA